MEKQGDAWIHLRLIERAVPHEYKFIVDNEWRFCPEQYTKKDEATGNINNYIPPEMTS